MDTCFKNIKTGKIYIKYEIVVDSEGSKYKLIKLIEKSILERETNSLLILSARYSG